MDRNSTRMKDWTGLGLAKDWSRTDYTSPDWTIHKDMMGLVSTRLHWRSLTQLEWTTLEWIRLKRMSLV